MDADRSDVTALRARRQEQKTREQLPAMRMLAAAAPVMDKLMTESDAWNRYLGMLQAQVERITKLRDFAKTRLADPGIWDPMALTKLKADVLQAEAMLGVLQFVMELPKALMEDGARAQQVVSQFEEKDKKDAATG